MSVVVIDNQGAARKWASGVVPNTYSFDQVVTVAGGKRGHSYYGAEPPRLPIAGRQHGPYRPYVPAKQPPPGVRVVVCHESRSVVCRLGRVVVAGGPVSEGGCRRKLICWYVSLSVGIRMLLDGVHKRDVL